MRNLGLKLLPRARTPHRADRQGGHLYIRPPGTKMRHIIECQRDVPGSLLALVVGDDWKRLDLEPDGLCVVWPQTNHPGPAQSRSTVCQPLGEVVFPEPADHLEDDPYRPVDVWRHEQLILVGVRQLVAQPDHDGLSPPVALAVQVSLHTRPPDKCRQRAVEASMPGE